MAHAKWSKYYKHGGMRRPEKHANNGSESMVLAETVPKTAALVYTCCRVNIYSAGIMQKALARHLAGEVSYRMWRRCSPSTLN